MKLYGQLESAQFENLAGDPTNSPKGRVYFDTGTNTVRYYNGSTWLAISQTPSLIPAATVTGTRASPSLITTAGITPGGYGDEVAFIAGNGGAIDVTANPQIVAGTTVGQTLELIGRHATNTVLLEDGAGLDLNGAWLGALSSVLGLRWDGTNWVERYRR